MRRTVPSILLILLLLGSCSPTRPPAGFTVITHPDGPLYVGDQVSFEVLPGNAAMSGVNLQIREAEQVIGTSGFGGYGVGGRQEAVFWWVWDTRGLEPGRHTLTFTTDPPGNTWTQTFSLHPASQVPPPEPEAHWTSVTSQCCTIHYITGTDAARDITSLETDVDEQAADVEEHFGAVFPDTVNITLMPRTLGHGGFASNGIYVSYLDRNYAGSTTTQVVHHELTHLLDAQLGGGYKPTVLVEGLAVYISGGHFKQEALLPRAAALFEPGWYIPLTQLSNDFYKQQHEIGYLEAGALVQYMVERYGWPAYDDFYRHMPDPGDRKPSELLDAALQDKFGITLTTLEQDFISMLHAQVVTDPIREDLKLTVRFYDTVRRYQQALDPSAYFLTAWLPDGPTMQEKGIVADLLRHPNGWKNRWVETLLVRADRDLRAGETIQAEKTLNEVDGLLYLFLP